MITYIFAGDHAQARATGKGIKFKGCFVYLDMYIAKMYRSAFASAYFYLYWYYWLIGEMY